MGVNTTSELDPETITPTDSAITREQSVDEDVHEITRDDRFRFIAQDFGDAIEALRETHDELSPAASELDSVDHVWDSAFESVKPLTHEDRLLLRSVFDDVPESGLTSRQVVDRLWDRVKDTEWGPIFTYNFVRRVHRPRRQPIFHNAILISVVAAFESHLSKLAEEYYRAAPDALHKLPREAVKEFSLRELQALGSIEDAIEMAIEQRVTALSFGSLADWKNFFSERMNIDLAKISGDWDSIYEAFERRHCIVHSEATASRRYIRNHPDVELREPLSADGDYVRRTMERLELLGMLLHMAVWTKFALDRQEVVDVIESRAFALLKEGRWEFSLRIYESWQGLPLSQAEQSMAKVNVWIARKNLHGPESIRDEVTTWDVSGSDEIYEFAKLCLVDDIDGAFEMLPMMVERDKVAGKELATWPLLSPLREDPRIQQYAEIMRDYLSDEADSKVIETEDMGHVRPLDDDSESIKVEVIPVRAEEATAAGLGEPTTADARDPNGVRLVTDGMKSEVEA